MEEQVLISKNPKKKVQKKIAIETIIAIIIAVTPFLLYSYNFFPDYGEKQVLFGYEISTLGFDSLSILVWYILTKAVPLCLLIIWFFTCKHWWYHVLIVPIVMYVFQLLTLFIDPETNVLGTVEIIWILPVCAVIIPIVYWTRLKLYEKYVLGIDLKQIRVDIQDMELKEEELNKKIKEIELNKQIN